MKYTYQLVCEGICNPQIAQTDDLVRRYGQDLSVSCVDALRTLRYTEHIRTSVERVCCAVCGAVRKY